MVQVGVVRKKDIIQSVKTSVELAGGMNIQKNSTVLIRPNANTADFPPGSTNPEVLRGAGIIFWSVLFMASEFIEFAD